MENRALQEWLKYCDGKSSHDPEYFSTIFMDFFIEPVSRDDLNKIFEFSANASRVVDKLILLTLNIEDRNDLQITEMVRNDLIEKKKILTSTDLLKAISSHPIQVVNDSDLFNETLYTSLHSQFYYELSNYMMIKEAEHDYRIRAISNAFYGLASNAHLQMSLTAVLLGLDVDFNNYIELFRIGVDYAIGDDRVIVINYHAI